MIVTCPKCGYGWDTRSRMRQITCPDCLRKFPQPKKQEDRLLGRLPGAEPCTICGHQGLDYNVCRLDGDLVILCDGCLRKLENEVK